MTLSLTGCLQADHRRLDAIFAECKTLAHDGRFADAARRFATFERGLSRHIDAEEDLLFPALVTHAPHATGPLGVMRAEHVEIRASMAALSKQLAASGPGWQAVAAELEDVLTAHNLKEERVLYPMADDATAGAPGLDELRERLSGMVDGRDG